MNDLTQYLIGVEFIFRNNSTNRPTLRHIANEQGSTYCGFYDQFAQSEVADETDTFYYTQICKKCLRSHWLKTRLDNIPELEKLDYKNDKP